MRNRPAHRPGAETSGGHASRASQQPMRKGLPPSAFIRCRIGPHGRHAGPGRGAGGRTGPHGRRRRAAPQRPPQDAIRRVRGGRRPAPLRRPGREPGRRPRHAGDDPGLRGRRGHDPGGPPPGGAAGRGRRPHSGDILAGRPLARGPPRGALRYGGRVRRRGYPAGRRQHRLQHLGHALRQVHPL